MTTKQLMLFDVEHFTIVLLGSQKTDVIYNNELGDANSRVKDKQPMQSHHNHEDTAAGMN